MTYTAQSNAVKRAATLCDGLTDAEKLEAVTGYLTRNLLYDYIKSVTLTGSYTPDVDATLESGTGICLDFAALTACMLRSQGIPTQLVIGYADGAYHAWNLVLIDDEWQRVDITAAVTNTNYLRYETERTY